MAALQPSMSLVRVHAYKCVCVYMCVYACMHVCSCIDLTMVTAVALAFLMAKTFWLIYEVVAAD